MNQINLYRPKQKVICGCKKRIHGFLAAYLISMNIIPSVDLLDGRVVRLHQGRYDEVTVYFSDPIPVLNRYVEAGFRRLHVVDLNGARDGNPFHLPLLASLLARPELYVQYGGGIRSREHLNKLFEAGVRAAVVTSMAVKTPKLWQEAVKKFGEERFIVGLDLKNGRVAYSGWMETAAISTETFIETQLDLGISTFLCTDVSKDGTLSGSNVGLYASLVNKYPQAKWIASGGFSGMQDVAPLREAGCFGVVVGRAFYQGLISLDEMKSAHQPT
jgi:phosphoribosylformimino-5-aminoimidazole carboxamide ribotide isomerase